jgi:hypothetical protein
MKNPDSAQQFLDLVSDFYRDAGWEEPVFEFDPLVPIAFEARVEDVTFSVGYDPLSEPVCLFAYCVFGVVPLTTEATTLRRLLALNVSMAQQHSAAYCIDDSTQELACYLRTTMDIDVQTLKARLAHIAQLAHRWRRDGLAGEQQDMTSMAKAGRAPSWMDFA